jgi:hypothetical protein
LESIYSTFPSVAEEDKIDSRNSGGLKSMAQDCWRTTLL